MSQGGPATSRTTLNLPDSSQSQLPATVASLPTSQAHMKPRAHKLKNSFWTQTPPVFLPYLRSLCSFPVCAHATMYHPNATCIGGEREREREARSKLPCREEERETREVERNQMGAQSSSGGKWMWACGNGGGNLQWRRNQFRLQPTCHVNFEF